jgi:hypothetical protein
MAQGNGGGMNKAIERGYLCLAALVGIAILILMGGGL